MTRLSADLGALGLLAFILVIALDVAGLLLDGALLLAGWTTITQLVWRYWWLGVPIVLLQALLPVAIAAHFFAEA